MSSAVWHSRLSCCGADGGCRFEHTTSDRAALYKELLELSTGHSVYLEEYARAQISSEEGHTMDILKMLKDFSEAPIGGARL